MLFSDERLCCLFHATVLVVFESEGRRLPDVVASGFLLVYAVLNQLLQKT
jgi:hypothetical protein